MSARSGDYGPPIRSRGWLNYRLATSSGSPRPVLVNATLPLRKAPEFEGVIGYNEFSGAVMLRARPPWDKGDGNWIERPWTDNDDRLFAEWLQLNGIIVTESVAAAAVETVAREYSYNPVLEYLRAITWDGQHRLDGWPARYLGARDDDYSRAVGRRWLISGIARAAEPGCKADGVLILEGPQGGRKSSAIAALGAPWYTDRLSDLASKDAAQEMSGVWLVELAELDSMTRAEIGTIKAFISRTHDRYRPPYGRRLVNTPRQCIFAGSVNPAGGYLKDPTGGRRFWPIRCGNIDLESLVTDRDQLWAEARDCYRSGQPWWLETPELEALAAAEQAHRYRGDPWDKAIADIVRGTEDVSVSDILNSLGIEKARWTQSDQNRVVNCLTSLGFERYRAREESSRPWRYRRTPGLE